MRRQPAMYIVCAAAFLLTLAVPWPYSLIPALVLCPLAPLLCMRGNRLPWKDPVWQANPETVDVRRIRGVVIDPKLLIGQMRISAEAWLPFEMTTAERFRGKSGALALSAAVALTDGCLAGEEGVSFHGAEEVGQWEAALGIVPDNFKRRSPMLDSAKYHGYTGVVVKDGAEVRAYFVGGSALAGHCVRILDGTERPILPADREKLAAFVPANALCYASAPVRDGRLDGLCWLGAVRPVLQCRVSEAAMAAGERLHEQGLTVALSGKSRWNLQTVRGMGIDWPEDDSSPEFVELALKDPERQDKDFAAPLESLAAHAGRDRSRRLLAAWMGLMLWVSAAACRSQWPLVIGLFSLCGGILLCRKSEIPAADGPAWKPFVLSGIPGVLIPVVMALFLPQLRNTSAETAGALMLAAEASVFAVWFPWTIRHQTKLAFELPLLFRHHTPSGWQMVGLAILGCLLGLMLVMLVTPDDLLAVLFGVIAGLLAGLSVTILWRQGEQG